MDKLATPTLSDLVFSITKFPPFNHNVAINQCLHSYVEFYKFKIWKMQSTVTQLPIHLKDKQIVRY